jgi:hypothetical protein
MKKVILFSLVVALITGGCTREKKSPDEGIWKLIYGKWQDWSPGDTLIYYFPGNIDIYHVKIFSNNYFTFVGHIRLDTIMYDNFGGGTFTLDGNRYEENVLFAGKAIFSRKVKMIQEIMNDTLVQKWPADENWKLADKYSIEKYIRLK